MSETASEIDRGAAGVLALMAETSADVPDLVLRATTPLTTLPPDLVALVVGRVQAGVSAFGADHPRATITRRIVLPSIVFAVVDAIGLIAAASTGHLVLAIVTTFLLLALAYLSFAGVRFVNADPLRVTPDQRAFVDAAKTWQSALPWTDDLRAGPWGGLVALACAAAGRIADHETWTWASVAEQRAQTELEPTLDSLDGAAFTLATNAVPAPSSAADDGPAIELVRRTAALRCSADAMDELAGRSAHGTDLRAELPRVDAQRLAELLAVARSSDGGPS